MGALEYVNIFQPDLCNVGLRAAGASCREVATPVDLSAAILEAMRCLLNGMFLVHAASYSITIEIGFCYSEVTGALLRYLLL